MLGEMEAHTTERQRKHYWKVKDLYYSISTRFDYDADKELVRFLKTEAEPNASAWIADACRQKFETERGKKKED